jgi:hypothetical protein
MIDIVVSKIVIFPIKSLDGISVSEALFVPSGALEHDREFALYDEAGRWINGKRDARIQTIRTDFDLSRFTVNVTSPGQPERQIFHMVDDQSALEAWFSSALDMPVFIKRDQLSGFPDDIHAGGPTIISTGTIVEISSWFGISDYLETRRRFRANIELSADMPFWEDRLFGPPRSEIPFCIGEAHFRGVGPCKRCIVPVRNSITGDETIDFQKTFTSHRNSTFPPWSNLARFGPLMYRVAINTRLADGQAGKRIKVGDPVNLAQEIM